MKRKIKEIFVEVESRGKVETYPVDRFDFTIGRSANADIQVSINEASRQHIRVFERDGQIFVVDLGSKNGTFLSDLFLESGVETLYPIGASLHLGRSKQTVRIRARVEAVKQEPLPESPPDLPPQIEDADTDISDVNLGEGEKTEVIASDPSVFEEEALEITDRRNLPVEDRDDDTNREDDESPRASKEKQMSSSKPPPHAEDAENEGRSEDISRTDTFTKPMRIPKNTMVGEEAKTQAAMSRKTSFSKLENVKGLVAEITKDAGKAIDENFFNIPPDKRASRRAERILKDVRSLAAELQEKAYDKHDRIIKKATEKATYILTEADKDRELILTEAREHIEKVKTEQLKHNEQMVDRILDEAADNAKRIVGDAEKKASDLGLKAQQAFEMAKQDAHTLSRESQQKSEKAISEARLKAEQIVNEAYLDKERVEAEVNDLGSDKKDLESLIARLGDEIEGWEAKTEAAQKAAELAIDQAQLESQVVEKRREELEAEVKRIDQEFAEFKEQRQRDQAQFLRNAREEEERVEFSLAEHKARVDSEKARLLKEYETHRQKLKIEYSAAQGEHEEKVRSLADFFEHKKVEIEEQVNKEKLKVHAELDLLKHSYTRREAEMASAFQSKEAEASEKFEKARSEIEASMFELEQERARIQATIRSLSSDHAELEESLKDLKVKVKASEDKLAKNNQTWSQATQDFQVAKQGVVDAQREKQHLEEDKQRLHSEILQMRDQRAQIEHAIDNLENTKATELKNISVMKEEALEQIRVERKRFDEIMASEKIDWEKTLEDQQQQALERSHQLIASAERVRDEAQKEAEDLVGRAQAESQVLAEQTESWRNEQLSDLEVTKKAWMDQFENSKLKLETDHRERMAALEAEFSGRQTELDQDFKQRSEKFAKDLEERVSRSEAESAATETKQRKQLQLELADLRVKRSAEVEAEIDSLRELYEEQKEERAKILNRSLDAKLVVALKPLLSSEDSKSKIDEISMDLQKVVMDTLIPDGDLKDEEFREAMGAHSRELIQASTIIWKRMAIAAAALFVIVSLPTGWRMFKAQTKEMASQQQETATANYIKKVEEKRRNKPKFEPEMKNEYFDTYTDRVLYTQSYADNELEPLYREKWILDLNDFFVEKLKLSENVIVTFIAKESNLIKELSRSREGINPQFVDKARAEMQASEKVFLDEITKTLGSKSKYKKYLAFKKKYYTEKYLERAPANK